MKISFTERLIELRKEDRKTQEEMANILNIKRSTYGAYERGQILPPYDKIESIAKYFNVSVDYLMGNTNNKNSSSTSNSQEVHDVNQALSDLLTELKNKEVPLKIDGFLLDNESRELLTASIENSLKMGQLLSSQKKKGFFMNIFNSFRQIYFNFSIDRGITIQPLLTVPFFIYSCKACPPKNSISILRKQLF